MEALSPEWPCATSSSTPRCSMYRVPWLPPLPAHQKLLRPLGYISFLSISANMPGPGSGKTTPGWRGSTDGLYASSAVYTNCAPCASKKPVSLTISNDQSEKARRTGVAAPLGGAAPPPTPPSAPPNGSPHEPCATPLTPPPPPRGSSKVLPPSKPSWKKQTHTLQTPPLVAEQAAVHAHALASRSLIDVRMSHESTSAAPSAPRRERRSSSHVEPAAITSSLAPGGTMSSSSSTCASDAVKMCSSGSGRPESSTKGGVRNFFCTAREFLPPVLDR
mmetsp:Transcript_92776/g.278333  ORF Transcript_92776/g.278333 Transcript_92776/m.278333 type:complete len:276 (-) Transcript_92776:231-1058(-)